MVDAHGRFTWYELITTDVKAAAAFYTAVMGWSTWDASVPGRPYIVLSAGDAPVAGLMQMPPGAQAQGVRPGWLGYVGVADVDVSAERVRRLGGVVHVPPTNVGNISRFAIFSDPQAAGLALFKWRQPGQRPPVDPDAPGRVGWHELVVTDPDQALRFYAALFGWQEVEAEGDEAGAYRLFSAAEDVIGGMVARPDTVSASFWLYYFNVGDIDAAAQRAHAGGGRIVGNAAEVPGGSLVVQFTDPQGAVFALEGQRGPVGYFERTGAPPTGTRGPRWSW